MARRSTYTAQHMCNSVGHNNISLQHGDIVDKQLVITLVDGDGDAQKSLVLPAILERSRISDVPDDAVIFESVDQLVGGELSDVDSGGLKCGIRRREAGKLWGGVNEVGEVGGLEGVEEC